MQCHYVWLLWSSAFHLPWLGLHVAAKSSRRKILQVSVATSFLGLSGPLFVPEYWNPPSLLELAQRTGFDLESLIFSFAIGGIGAVIYDALAIGSAATVACRPDLTRNTLLGGALFIAFYAVFMVLLLAAAPGYIERVWNLPALSGVLPRRHPARGARLRLYVRTVLGGTL